MAEQGPLLATIKSTGARPSTQTELSVVIHERAWSGSVLSAQRPVDWTADVKHARSQPTISFACACTKCKL